MTCTKIVGRFLDGLDAEARARVIASPMEQCGWGCVGGVRRASGCLVETALGITSHAQYPTNFPFLVAFAYDDMVAFMGQGRANQWVRERAIAGGEAPVENRPASRETVVA